MDKIKDLANKAKGGSSGSSNNTGGGAGKQDYGDKGLEYVEKQTGHSQSRETNEKVTDKGREFYEKQSGNQVPEKYSN